MNTPGVFAHVALILWVPLSLLAFLLTRPERAALFTIFGGLLFLPELADFKIPFLPAFTKENIPYLCVILWSAFRSRRVLRLPQERWVTLLTLLVVAGGVGMALTNRDSLTYGDWIKRTLPGLTIKDGMFVALGWVLNVAVPFFVGSVLFRTARDLRALFRFVAATGLVYALFALVEIRMSPQFNVWVYGYHQHPDFQQTMRFGGYRPAVFMAHGLAVALFFAVATLFAIGLARLKTTVWGVGAGVVAAFLGAIVVLCKSTGAIVYGLVAVPVAALGGVRLKQRLASLVAGIVLLYPALRAADLFPVQGFLSAASIIGQERRGSLEFRFENEDALLKKARERPWFGWGLYGRSVIYDGGGRSISVTDGAWIIVMGTQGVAGFVGEFGLLLVPIFLAGRRLKMIRDKKDRLLLTNLSLVVAITAVDLIPNGHFSNYSFFLSGALLSLSRTLGPDAASVDVHADSGEQDQDEASRIRMRQA